MATIEIPKTDLEDFMKIFRECLSSKLESISLTLIDAGLIYGPEVNKERTYYLVGVVERKITGQKKAFKSQIGIDMGKTEPEDLDVLIMKIYKELKLVFYKDAPAVYRIH